MDDGFGGDDPIGCTNIVVKEMVAGKGKKEFFTLLYKNKNVGTVCLESVVSSPPSTEPTP